MYPARILIADDDIEIIKIVSANLKYEKYETLVAMDGIEALEIVKREMPDLVILDITMPKMDGFEVCKKIREWSQIPIIMLSARGDVENKVKCLNFGADDYISKPFKMIELNARIKAVSRRKKDFLKELPGKTILRIEDTKTGKEKNIVVDEVGVDRSTYKPDILTDAGEFEILLKYPVNLSLLAMLHSVLDQQNDINILHVESSGNGSITIKLMIRKQIALQKIIKEIEGVEVVTPATNKMSDKDSLKENKAKKRLEIKTSSYES